MPATQWYKGRPYGVKTQDFAAFCGGGLGYHAGGILLDGRLLHDRWSDSNPVCGRLLRLTPATQRYKGRPYGIRTQDFTDLYGGGLR